MTPFCSIVKLLFVVGGGGTVMDQLENLNNSYRPFPFKNANKNVQALLYMISRDSLVP